MSKQPKDHEASDTNDEGVATYNHAFSISFAVSKSDHADPYEAWQQEKHKVIFHLLQRVSELCRNESDYLSAYDAYDTYEESNLPTILELD